VVGGEVTKDSLSSNGDELLVDEGETLVLEGQDDEVQAQSKDVDVVHHGLSLDELVQGVDNRLQGVVGVLFDLAAKEAVQDSGDDLRIFVDFFFEVQVDTRFRVPVEIGLSFFNLGQSDGSFNFDDVRVSVLDTSVLNNNLAFLGGTRDFSEFFNVVIIGSLVEDGSVESLFLDVLTIRGLLRTVTNLFHLGIERRPLVPVSEVNELSSEDSNIDVSVLGIVGNTVSLGDRDLIHWEDIKLKI